MPRVGCLGKVIIAAIVFFVILIAGSVFFRLPEMAHVELAAEEVFSVGGFPITNTMLGAWLTILVLGVVCYAATRRMKLVPTGLQNAVEAAIETILNFVEDVAGKEHGPKFFPVIATIFLFVVTNAWLALVPGFSTIGVIHTGGEGDVLLPLMRGANTDVNFPLALALISFVFVEYWGIKVHGFFRYTRKFLNVRPLLQGVGQVLRGRIRSGLSAISTGIIDAFAGFIEAITEIARIMSFTFRLFGNMTAGELLLFVIVFLIPWGAAIPFYGLELFIGLVQALIFAGLTLVFVVIAVSAHDEQ
jgi:F-type H+-transporting ATPase subunit a